MVDGGGGSTCYDILQLHPAAPLDLITAVYWRLAGQAQASRGTNRGADAALWALARAYEVLADPRSRTAHDQANGIAPQALVPRLPARRRGRRLFSRVRRKEMGDASVDYYDILRVLPVAEPVVIKEAYATLRSFYLRLVHLGGQPPALVDYLEEAFSIVSDPGTRSVYDEARSERGKDLRKLLPGRKRGERAKGSQTDAGATALGKNETAPAGTATAEDSPDDSRGIAAEPRAPDAGTPAEDSVAMNRAPAEPPVEVEPLSEPHDAASEPTDEKWPAGVFGPVGSPAGTAPQEDTPGAEKEASAPATGHYRDATEHGGPLRAVTGGASHLVRSLGRQLSNMSKREMEQQHEMEAKRDHEHEREEDADMEDVLLQRLSISAAPMQDRPSGEDGKHPVVRLELVEGPGRGAAYELDQFPMTLGGDDGCDISLPGLAAHKARLLYRDGRFVVYNLAGSSEGVAGDAAPWWILESGDDLRLGPYTLRFTARSDDAG